MQKYILKHENLNIAQFTLDFERQRLNLIYVDPTNSLFYPWGIAETASDLLYWFHSRMVSERRLWADRVYKKYHYNWLRALVATRGLSLEDNYWVVPESDKDLDFFSLDLFTHPFSSSFRNSLLMGRELDTSGIDTSADLYLDGYIPKCWVYRDSQYYLYKRNFLQVDVDNTIEYFTNYSEVWASQVAQIMGFSFTPYSLASLEGYRCCCTPIFTSLWESFVPFRRLEYFRGEVNWRMVYNYLEDLFSDLLPAFQDLLIFDYLILNTDRHTGNFGFLVNNATCLVNSFAPLFDNGMGLLGFKSQRDIEAYHSISVLREFYESKGRLGNLWEGAQFALRERHYAGLEKLVNYDPLNINNNFLRQSLVRGIVQDGARRLLSQVSI